jgi:hypothetical protein
MTNIFVACPSYRGASDEDVKQLISADKLEAAGYPYGIMVCKGMAHLDLARAELQAIYRKNSQNFPLLLWQDDDVMVESASLLAMLAVLAKRQDVDVLVAPYKLRFSGERGAPEGGHLYSVSVDAEALKSASKDADGICPVVWTGLGCVLVRKEIVEKLYSSFSELCFPAESPQALACGVFNSMVVPAKAYDPNAKGNMFFGDDRSWSHRLKTIGVTVWAYLDAVTKHRDLDGCLGADLRASGSSSEKVKSGLLGPDGKPL